jgi:hypothetical protein
LTDCKNLVATVADTTPFLAEVGWFNSLHFGGFFSGTVNQAISIEHKAREGTIAVSLWSTTYRNYPWLATKRSPDRRYKRSREVVGDRYGPHWSHKWTGVGDNIYQGGPTVTPPWLNAIASLVHRIVPM